MELIGSRFCFHLNDYTTRLRKLGVEIAGCGIESFHGIDRGIDDNNAQYWVIIVHAINHKVGSAEQLSVGIDLDTALWILGLAVLPRHFCRSREQQLQFREVSIDDG